MAVAWLLSVASIVAAHDGSPRLQLGADRVNPGGTLEVVGDLKAEGTVELALDGAGGSTLALGTILADHDGHFRAFVTVPADVSSGSYSLWVRSGVEEARVDILVAGPPVSAGDQGQLPGQDEARAGAGAASNVAPLALARPASEPPVGATSAGAIAIGITIVVALGLALGIGTLVRAGSRRPAR